MAVAGRNAWIEAWEADLTPSRAALRSAARAEARVRSHRYYGPGATARLPRPSSATEREAATPALRVVTRRRARWPLVAVLLLLGVIFLSGTIVTPMLVSAAVTEVESRGAKAEAVARQLSADIGALSVTASELSAPERVAEQAKRLGLVPAETVRYVGPDGNAVESETGTVLAGR